MYKQMQTRKWKSANIIERCWILIRTPHENKDQPIKYLNHIRLCTSFTFINLFVVICCSNNYNHFVGAQSTNPLCKHYIFNGL